MPMSELNRKCLFLTIVFNSVFLLNAFAQEEKPDKFHFQAYISNLNTFDFSSDSLRYDFLLHNRLKFGYDIKSNLNFKLEIRNRLYYGETPDLIPFFNELLDSSNDYFDLSVSFPKAKKWIFHSMIDRAYLEYFKNDWEFRIGRQRVNWGINTVWNPHDLFNAFSFFDFDYIERPGTDAVLIKRYLGFASSIELVSNMFDDFDRSIIGLKYTFNKSNYDYQLIAAKALEDMCFGLGWSGNISLAGFKAEINYFVPYENNTARGSSIAASIGLDYSFTNGFYLNYSALYSSDTADKLNVLAFSFNNSASVTARQLSPYKFSNLLQASYSFSPLFNASLAFIYFPGEQNALFVNPVLNYSLMDDTDLSFIAQLYADKLNGDYQLLAKAFYLRIKKSY